MAIARGGLLLNILSLENWTNKKHPQLYSGNFSSHLMPQKILFIRTDTGTFDPRVFKESTTLAAAGYDVRFFGWDRRREVTLFEDRQGVKFSRVRIPAPYGSKLLVFFLPFFWIATIRRVFIERPHAVHACDLDAFIPCVITKLLLGHVLVYDIFDHFAEKLIGVPSFVRRGVGWFDRRLMAFADAVVVTDDKRRELVISASPKRIAIIMNVPNESLVHFSMPQREMRITLCYAGGIHENRGLYQVADATRNLQGVRTIFAGWVPREQDREFLVNQEHIEFRGKVSYQDALHLVGAADVVLAFYDTSLPINALASSNKVFEAMAAGRPILTNSGTSMDSIIKEVDCGLLVPYGSSDALREAIIFLRDHPESRERLGMNGRRAFVETYNWSTMAERLVELYTSFLTPASSKSIPCD
jgi:glycosyltransferase involved in cell wall biosynthesis